MVAQRIDSGEGEGSRELRCHGELAEPSVRKGEPSWLVLICCDWSSAASLCPPSSFSPGLRLYQILSEAPLEF